MQGFVLSGGAPEWLCGLWDGGAGGPGAAGLARPLLVLMACEGRGCQGACEAHES